MSKPKIVFMGTPDFAVPTLEILSDNYDVVAAVTVPDKPQGRGRKIKFSPVKDKALELDIPVLQPESLRDSEFIKQLSEFNPDIICVVAFRILPPEVYSLANIETFNIHGSLLPKYRGAAPINWAIINGESKTGVTTFILDKKVDTGKILLKREVNITPETTAGDLHDRLMIESTQIAVDTVEFLLTGRYHAEAQNDDEASPAPKIFREDCKIDFDKPATEVRNFIHGLSPFPAAWSLLDGKNTKFIRVKVVRETKLNPAEYLIENNKLIIGTKDTAIEVLEIKPEGKKSMKVEDMIRGFRGELKGKLT
jgi:methionyl-tRNA formyltransferase